MGYCYNKNGSLLCDMCGKPHAKKVRCPFGYCPPTAMCDKCKVDHANMRTKEYHRNLGCERLSKAHDEREQQKRDLLESGRVVRCSAKSTDDGMVHVLFQTITGACVGRYMSHSTYDAIPLLVVATPEDYEKYGEVIDAPPSFAW